MYRVVLVDDEKWNLQGLEQLIDWHSHGFTISCSTGLPQVAYEHILEHNPELLITDIRMPQMSGIQLIQNLRARGVDIEIVLLSAYGDFYYAQQAIAAGVAGYCLKPIKTAELIAVLDKVKEKLAAKKDKLEYLIEQLSKITKTIPEPGKKEPEHTQLAKIVQYINDNITENIMLKDLAKMFFLNANYCSYLFRKHMKMPYTTYVNTVRVNHAKTLLQDKNLCVAEIATLVGYNDYFYFNKIFKKLAGVTPKKYREELI